MDLFTVPRARLIPATSHYMLRKHGLSRIPEASVEVLLASEANHSSQDRDGYSHTVTTTMRNRSTPAGENPSVAEPPAGDAQFATIIEDVLSRVQTLSTQIDDWKRRSADDARRYAAASERRSIETGASLHHLADRISAVSEHHDQVTRAAIASALTEANVTGKRAGLAAPPAATAVRDAHEDMLSRIVQRLDALAPSILGGIAEHETTGARAFEQMLEQHLSAQNSRLEGFLARLIDAVTSKLQGLHGRVEASLHSESETAQIELVTCLRGTMVEAVQPLSESVGLVRQDVRALSNSVDQVHASTSSTPSALHALLERLDSMEAFAAARGSTIQEQLEGLARQVRSIDGLKDSVDQLVTSSSDGRRETAV